MKKKEKEKMKPLHIGSQLPIDRKECHISDNSELVDHIQIELTGVFCIGRVKKIIDASI